MEELKNKILEGIVNRINSENDLANKLDLIVLKIKLEYNGEV
ncbi:hypothetical protein [Enterocloster citroniae]